MKRFTIACLVLAALATPAEADNAVMTGDAVIANDCAPWDGFAMRVTVTFEDKSVFYASVWGKGLAPFRAGKEFDLDGKFSEDGTGSGRSCTAANVCRNVGASLNIPAEALKSDTPIKGFVTIENSIVPVTAHRMKDQQPQICG